MPMFTSKLRPANPNYEDNDKILDKPLRSKWRFVQTWIESYRAKLAQPEKIESAAVTNGFWLWKIPTP